MAIRFGVVFVAAAATAGVPLAAAQEWTVGSGATARVGYSDNYFLTTVDTQSAITATVTPFVTAARQTETSAVTALVAVGANKVWGLSPTVDYLSGNFGLDASVRDALSTWTGSASFVRSASLENEFGQPGNPLVLAYTNAAAVTGSYTYALTERWSLGTMVGAYSNRYEGVENGASLSNNHGYSVVGNAGYAYSEGTRISFAAGYSNYMSNVTRSDSVTATVGVVHQFSPQLTISASVGGFWGDIDATVNNAVGSNRTHDNGELYGGSISYALSEHTQFIANLSENLAPSSSGTLSKNEAAAAYLTYQFSDRLTSRLGANYARTIIPATISSSSTTNNSSTTNYYQGEIGFSYLLAERWKLDAGYQYGRARYGQMAGEPRSNFVFVSIGYNWPGGSFTDWVGRHSNTQSLPGAGAVSLPESSPAAPSPEASPFDRFTIP